VKPLFLDDPPLAFAHRGGAADGDENTIESFARAAQAGYRYIETDVHATRDGVPVVMHDPDLSRMTGHQATVAGLSYADLATIRVAGSSAIPRLEEVLEAWPGLRFNIDVKSDAAVAPVASAVLSQRAEDRVLLASFSDSRLRRLRTLTKETVATSLAQAEVARLWLAARLGRRFSVPPTAVAAQVPVRHGRIRVVNKRFLAAAHRSGLQVHVWTIDNPDEMTGLLDLGVDGIMTDRITVLREVFIQRGLWKDTR
jgi:glycerophosphoryl diester phosphodiesterase